MPSKRRLSQLFNRRNSCDHPKLADISQKTAELESTGSERSAEPLENGCLKLISQTASLSETYPARISSKKAVKWADISIHSHERILGDNPSVSNGPPVSIAWKAFETISFSVDEYENGRPTPRQKGEMLTPRMLREDTLRHAGYARSELKEATDLAARVREQRNRSSRDGQLQAKIKKLFKASSSSSTSVMPAATSAAATVTVRAA